MEGFIRYILISTLCLSVLYLAYLLFQKKETRFHQLRYFLLISIILSLLIPFSTFRIELSILPDKYKIEEIEHDNIELESVSDEGEINPSIVNPKPDIDLIATDYLIIIYFLGLIFFCLRIVSYLSKIVYLFVTSNKIVKDKIVLLNSKAVSPFTFMNWIFISSSFLEVHENKEILIHERIHASQYHSIDILLIELLSAVMWFNPLIWMMKKSLQLVHEYLADEGVLNTGTDKLRYQALLLNQVAEERLICLSSSFNHSLIKKRMIMMTKSKFNQGSKLRILVLIPVATILFVAVACVNGQDNSKVVTAVEPVRMNVLYIGVDNPIKIAASGYNASDLTATIDNGTISGKDGEFIIRPDKTGSAIVTVSNSGNKIQETTFRVKSVPNPVAKVAGLKGGNISKHDLVKAGDIQAVMENFDFDLNLKVEGFLVSTVIDGYLYEYKSNSNKITEEQKGIIAKTKEGSKVYFEEIKYLAPDGVEKDIPTVAFKIVE